MKNNYLARLSDVFGLRHVKVICASSEDNVAAESSTAPLWRQWANSSSDLGDRVRPTQTAEAPACAVALRRALDNVTNEQIQRPRCIHRM